MLYGYKGLLQVTALILAFRTRKVKVKGLDDSKYIAAAIYISSIVLAVIIVATYTLTDYINAFPAVEGAGFLLGTTMILVFVFVPKVSIKWGRGRYMMSCIQIMQIRSWKLLFVFFFHFNFFSLFH